MSQKTAPRDKAFVIRPQGTQKFLRLFGDSQKIKGLRSGYVVLKPGQAIGRHDTGPSEEVIYVISGKGRVAWGKRGKIKVEANSFVYIPPRTSHDVANNGRGLLKYIYTASRVYAV